MAVDLGRQRLRQLVVQIVLPCQLPHGARDGICAQHRLVHAAVMLDVVDEEVRVGDESCTERLHPGVRRRQVAAYVSAPDRFRTANADHVAGETALRDRAAQLEIEHARDVAGGDLIAQLLQQHLLVLGPLEARQVHHQIAVGFVLGAFLARAPLQRGEAATSDLHLMPYA